MKEYIIERLKERSTWRGIVYVLAAVGAPLAPAMGEQIISVGMGIAGLMAIVLADKK